MTLLKKISKQIGAIAVLIDPEKTKKLDALKELIQLAEKCQISYFFVGGSTVTRDDLHFVVQALKHHSSIPVILFPGAYHQISNEADGTLFLNLISGRNPDFLIGHHIQAAAELRKMDLEILSTSYVLIDGESQSSVAYISQTQAIPNKQFDLISNTCLAGEYIGHHLIFLDAGSGAKTPVNPSIVESLKRETLRPIIVGGGIRTKEQITSLVDAKANIIVLGNILEENPGLLEELCRFRKQTSF